MIEHSNGFGWLEESTSADYSTYILDLEKPDCFFVVVSRWGDELPVCIHGLLYVQSGEDGNDGDIDLMK